LRGIIASRLGGFKVLVDIDPQTSRDSGPIRAHLGRTKVSVWLLTWDHVIEAEKNMIWQDLTVSNSF